MISTALFGALVTTLALIEIFSYFSPTLRTTGWGGLTMMALPTATLFTLLGSALLWITWQKGERLSAVKEKPLDKFESHTSFRLFT